MEDSPITRQHETTSMSELHGQNCDYFLALYDDDCSVFSQFYLKLDGVFHRFFLNAGLLFWRSHQSPDVDHDLDCDHYRYINLGTEFQVVGTTLTCISMDDCCLDIEFGNGVRFLLHNEVFGYGSELIRIA